MKSLYSRLRLFGQAAFQPVDGASLAAFRVIFGIGLAAFAVKSLLTGEVRGIYVDPANHFSYYGFSWIQPWPGNGMYLHFVALAVTGGLMAAGIAWRATSITAALLFSFIFLCDRTAYLNHHYLILLLCWMMTLLPADRVASFDGLNRADDPPAVPRWTVWLVQFHVAIPYLFGGIAKITPDWLRGQPMRMTLSQQGWFESASQIMGSDTIIMLFAIGGLVFDLIIVPALLFHRTRMVAFCVATMFHLTNAFVFPIGVFPWLMIGATTIFFRPDWPRRLFSHQADESQTATTDVSPVSVYPQTPAPRELADVTWTARQKQILAGLSLCVLFHCVVPLRHLFTTGNPSWTERGHFFAWHMMLRGKRCGLRMYVTDKSTGQTVPADLRQYITAYQYPKVGRDPEHIRQLAHMIASSTDRSVEVRALAIVSLNGREAELLVDPLVNLAAEGPSWTHPAWIRQLTNPLLRDHWNVPLLQWESALGIDCRELYGMPDSGSLPVNTKTAVRPGNRISENPQSTGVEAKERT